MDEDEYLDEDDLDEEDLIDHCGMTPDGNCMLAGTEWCDWDCPMNKGGAP